MHICYCYIQLMKNMRVLTKMNAAGTTAICHLLHTHTNTMYMVSWYIMSARTT